MKGKFCKFKIAFSLIHICIYSLCNKIWAAIINQLFNLWILPIFSLEIKHFHSICHFSDCSTIQVEISMYVYLQVSWQISWLLLPHSLCAFVPCSTLFPLYPSRLCCVDCLNPQQSSSSPLRFSSLLSKSQSKPEGRVRLQLLFSNLGKRRELCEGQSSQVSKEYSVESTNYEEGDKRTGLGRKIQVTPFLGISLEPSWDLEEANVYILAPQCPWNNSSVTISKCSANRSRKAPSERDFPCHISFGEPARIKQNPVHCWSQTTNNYMRRLRT